MNRRKFGCALGALLLGTLFQIIVSGQSLAATAIGTMTSRGSWLSTDSYVAGDIVTFNGTSYVAQTHSAGTPPASNAAEWAAAVSANTGGSSDPVSGIAGDRGRVRYAGSYRAGQTYAINHVVKENGASYRALSNNARDDPAYDVLFAGGYWAIFAGEELPLAMPSTPAPDIGPSIRQAGRSETRGTDAHVDRGRAAPKSRMTAENPGYCNEIRPYDPPYEAGHGDGGCGVRTRDDYAAVGALLLFTVIQGAARWPVGRRAYEGDPMMRIARSLFQVFASCTMSFTSRIGRG